MMKSVSSVLVTLLLLAVATSALRCPGCPVSVPVTRSDVLAAANFAATSVAANAEVSDVVVKSAKVQVIAGVNFFVNFEATYNGVVHEISATVFQDLNQAFSLTAYSVAETRPADTDVLATCAGCLQPVNSTDPAVQAAINFLWTQVQNQDATLTGVAATSLTIVSAQSQIVAGVNYYLHLRTTVGSTVVDVSGVVYANPQGDLSLTSLAVAKSSASQ
eukprot:TRINITY_DN1616_c0_g1_i1.p1 TRINITY_DN1616_c0_g1~~TRINITY_DN1616_c0_g1_i1.p1  ORF type:complete len:218 (-),score=59.78 TRINITY_DN1616_c0_g1_i1:46-699(-)